MNHSLDFLTYASTGMTENIGTFGSSYHTEFDPIRLSIPIHTIPIVPTMTTVTTLPVPTIPTTMHNLIT